MKHLAVPALCILLAACAHTPVAQPPAQLFSDQLFAAPSERIRADDVFALSDEMKRYLETEMAGRLLNKGLQKGLIDALYSQNQLRLDYDATMTRNAAQAFEARSGNCLSLVIMTAAFARELGLDIQYQSAYLDETWTRSGSLFFKSGHVNITIGRRMIDSRTNLDSSELTIDFLPASEIRGLRTRAINEETVVAMYMNNQAAEALAKGELSDAYWWARAAIAQNPAFLSSYNTLGVVYLRHGHLLQAEQVFNVVLDREPANTPALSNLANLLNQQSRTAEAKVLLNRLAQIEPYPPFYFFNLGRAAMEKDDFKAARDFFAKEVD